MALTSNVTVAVQANLTGDPVGAGTNVSLPLPFSYSASLASGTAANQADKVYSKRRTVSTGTPDDIDLAGVLTDALGNALTFVEIVGVFIKNNSTVAGQDLQVGGDAAFALIGWVGAANDFIVVKPGGVFCIFNPNDPAYAVTAGTGDLLQVAVAAGTGVTYDILILGRSA